MCEIASQAPPTITLTTEQARAALPDVASALDANDVSFSMLFQTVYDSRPLNPDPMSRAAARALVADVSRAFESKNGRIEEEYWCDGLRAAVALTATGKLFSNINWEDSDADVVELIRQADIVDISARRLGDEDRKTCVELVFVAYSSALDILDRRRESPGKPLDASLALTGRQVADARDFLNRAASRQAHIAYVQGMAFGLLLLGVVIIAVLAALPVLQPLIAEFPGARLPVLLTTAGAGAAGAVLSVMTRWADGTLRLSAEAGVGQTRLLGFFRPLVGALLGGFVNILATGGLLPLRLPDDLAVQRNFLLGLALISGFSERWARDVLRAPRNE